MVPGGWVPLGLGVGDVATVSLHSNWYHVLDMSSVAKLFIIVFVMSQEDERISTPMNVFQKIVLPWVIQPGFAPPIRMRKPPQTKSIAATGGIRPIKTKSIMFLKSLNRSQRVHSAGLTDVPHGTKGHQLTAETELLKATNKRSERIIITGIFFISGRF